MTLLPNIIFGLISLSGIGFFVKNINKLRRNIKLGKSIDDKIFFAGEAYTDGSSWGAVDNAARSAISVVEALIG